MVADGIGGGSEAGFRPQDPEEPRLRVKHRKTAFLVALMLVVVRTINAAPGRPNPDVPISTPGYAIGPWVALCGRAATRHAIDGAPPP